MSQRSVAPRPRLVTTSSAWVLFIDLQTCGVSEKASLFLREVKKASNRGLNMLFWQGSLELLSVNKECGNMHNYGRKLYVVDDINETK